MKNLNVALRVMVLLTLITGVAYPIVVTLVGRAIFPRQSEGSLLFRNNELVGSSLLAQETKGEKYFHPRPSAVNYALPSGGSNLGPTSAALKKAFEERRAAAEPVSASGSGLDPHISPEEAMEQIGRVAKARGLTEPALRAIVGSHTQDRTAGILGMPRVNVLELNLNLDEAK